MKPLINVLISGGYFGDNNSGTSKLLDKRSVVALKWKKKVLKNIGEVFQLDFYLLAVLTEYLK